MKRIKVLITALAITTLTTFPALAEWKQQDGKWWYQNEDGSYPINQWQDIDGKQYYFGEDGYMLSNTTTPDGRQVGEDGALLQAPLFDFDIEDSRIVYTGFKIKKDYDGNNCLVLYYDFTNKDSEPQSAIWADYGITIFQNGVQCDTAFVWEDRDNSMDNYSKEVTQGTTLNVACSYELQDMSDVSIRIEEMWNWSNPKTQNITLKIQ